MCVCASVCVLPPLRAPSNTLSSSITSAVLTHWLLKLWGLGLTYSHRPSSLSLSISLLRVHAHRHAFSVVCVCVCAYGWCVHTRRLACLSFSGVMSTLQVLMCPLDICSHIHQCRPHPSWLMHPNDSQSGHYNNWVSSGDRASSSSPQNPSPINLNQIVSRHLLNLLTCSKCVFYLLCNVESIQVGQAVFIIVGSL